ncbi:MAG: tRNA (adenosine(37)-N6)-threonylcarbamoyltransferase complex transferase subunit TsaD [Fidelibacterota bacterium]|nr:MAG: tRNA (adenosine(37)-N6)-threonylcarbamoyltransferase complex transferase subunit TsaD [Candidatus Neomarinimicrobiota bacterium]
MIVLGIESSCDETAAAVVADGSLRSNIITPQPDHTAYGGVVPEVASRLHELHIIPVVEQALAAAGTSIHDLTGIAATYGPGLAGALIVGLNFAKGLAQSLSLPFIGIDHMEGHLWANFLQDPPTADSYPYLCLLASGGHTHLWRVDGVGQYTLLGRSLDDAAGEAFDKGARLLGLGYPGGPAIEAVAEKGDPQSVDFPRPMKGSPKCDFSFSGLKTALYHHLRDLSESQQLKRQRHIAAAYQEAIVDSLLDRLQQGVRLTGLSRVCVAGGVSANARLRNRLDDWAASENLSISYPPLEFCTDNAAMIAMAGYVRLQAGDRSSLDLEVKPNLSLADHSRPSQTSQGHAQG